jgi:dTDP-4-amino-4,6-dideoxygalactose transaminase
MSGSAQIKFTRLDRQYALIKDELLPTIDNILSSGQLMDGEYTAQFEREMSAVTGCRHSISCHSGTQALEMMLTYYRQQYDYKPTLLVPSVTFPATVNAAITAGWNVHIVDVDANGIINFDNVDFNKYRFSNPVSIMLVGLYGHTHMLYEQLLNLLSAAHSGEFIQHVFVDAAQHLFGTKLNKVNVNCSALSFDPTKNLANNGNGGMVVTNDKDLDTWLRQYRSNGKPHFNITGTNSRMSEIDCATLSIKLKHIDKWQLRRKEIAQYWIEQFKDCNGIKTLITEQNIHNHAFQKFVITSPNRNKLQQDLIDSGIDVRVQYQRAIHEYEAFAQYDNPGVLSVGSALCRQVLSLPFYAELTDSEVNLITELVITHSS